MSGSDELVAQFVSLTGADTKTAEGLLEVPNRGTCNTFWRQSCRQYRLDGLRYFGRHATWSLNPQFSYFLTRKQEQHLRATKILLIVFNSSSSSSTNLQTKQGELELGHDFADQCQP